MLEEIIKSYLYTQYQDDKDLQSLVDAYNAMAQEIYDWMRDAALPVFIGDKNVGEMLTWTAKGIYGQDRPVLESTRKGYTGPFNQLQFNQLPYAGIKENIDDAVVSQSDDLFKRILVWNFYKGDGFHFTIPWIKRRIARFLTGVDGVSKENDQHFAVSVLFGAEGLSISVTKRYRRIKGLAMFGACVYNQALYADKTSESFSGGGFEYTTLFKAAFESGLLHLPFYQPVSISISE